MYCENFLKKIIGKSSEFSITCAIYVASLVAIFSLPKLNWHVIKFDRVFGNGIVNDWDVSRLNWHFYLYFFILAITYWVANFVFFALGRFIGEERHYEISYIAIIGIVLNTLVGISAFNDGVNIYLHALWLPLIFMVMYIIGTILKFEEKNFIDLIGASIGLLILTYVVFADKWIKYAVPLIFILIMCTVVFFKSFWHRKNQNKYHWYRYIPLALSAIPLVIFISVEITHILPQRGEFVANPMLLMVSLVLFCIITAIGFGLTKKERNNDLIVPALTIISVGLLTVQRSFWLYENADIFETANSSILISDWFNFGIIPIVGHYGGHMMTDVLEGILYGWLTGDKYGAIVSPYRDYLMIPIIAFLFFLLIRPIVKSTSLALLAVLCIPFIGELRYFGFGILVCLAAGKYLQIPSAKTAIYLCASCVICAIYRLDLGFAYIVAVVCTFIWGIVIKKSVSWLKNILIIGGIFAVFLAFLWCVLCLLNDTNPIDRLKEFILISASNKNWAYASIGNPQLLAFGLAYAIMPLVIIVCLIKLMGDKKAREYWGLSVVATVVILGFCYFGNYTRGLVRHSLAEMNIRVVFWTSFLFLVLFATLILRKANILFPLLLIAFVASGLLSNNSVYMRVPLIHSSIENIVNQTNSWRKKESNGKTFWENLKDKNEQIDRVRIDGNLKARIVLLDKFLKTYLHDDESYVDFINRSFLYSATSRFDPVYAAQSPIHLSGEFSQEMFVQEIEKNLHRLPIAILPSNNNAIGCNLDGVPHVIRYYKVAEAIYKHYRPFVALDEYRIWVRKDKYGEFIEKYNNKNSFQDNLEKIGNFLINDLTCWNCLVEKSEKSFTIKATQIDPILANIQDLLELKSYIGKKVRISFEYKSTVPGVVQLFYTTDLGEDYTGSKVLNANVDLSGTAFFELYVTPHTKVRFDTTEGSMFTIYSFKVEDLSSERLIDYGYDKNNNLFHNYNLNHLPRIWGDYDTREASKNKVVANIKTENDKFIIPKNIEKSEKGNYLLVKIVGKAGDARVEIYGNRSANEQLYSFGFTKKEGAHNYLFRLSSDYWWNNSEIDFLKITNTELSEIKDVLILEAD